MKFDKLSEKLSFEENPPHKVELSLGEKPLYFKNVGLFSDNFMLNHLDKSKDVYIMQNWETEDLPSFNACYEWMLSTWAEKREDFEKMKEAQLEEEWIKPILQRLGWEYTVQPGVLKHGKRQIPDYALFESSSQKKKASGADENKLFDIATLVGDAKAMKIDLDGDAHDNTNPSYQIIQYMSYTGKDWGILTNGRYWRLYSTRAKTRFRAYYEVNIEKILNSNAREDKRFKYFFNFFRKEAFSASEGTQSFVNYTFNEGQQYAVDVEKELKTRAFEVVEQIAQGFAGGRRNLDEGELKTVYDHSLYYLFRLIFILNCEAKGLLNVNRQSDYFTYSLRSLCMKLRGELSQNAKWSNQSVSYGYIKSLFKLLAVGDSAIGIHGFGNEVFESGKKAFYQDNEISDKVLNHVLVELACRYDKKAKEYKFIDYERLSIDHLGSIFEGLLEYRLSYEGSELVLLNSSGERKATGSYYTPDYLVDHVVNETMAPIIEGKSAQELLKLKVCDPTMGSGHFLLGAVKFLEEAVIEKVTADEIKSISLTSVRKQVLTNCIFGTDINPLAVELAKFSLWMFSCQKTDSLERLADQLSCEDSLIPKSSHYKDGFESASIKYDCIVGNPPWDKLKFDEEEFLRPFSKQLSSKKISKTEKKKIFEKILSNSDVKNKFDSAKSKVEARIQSVKSEFYEFQEDSGEQKARFIDFNLYKLAVERFLKMLTPDGRIGLVVPTGLFGDLGCSGLRKFLFTNSRVEQIVGFNKSAKVFNISQPFCYFVSQYGSTTKKFKYIDGLFADDMNSIGKRLKAAPAIDMSLIKRLAADTFSIPTIENELALQIFDQAFSTVDRFGHQDLDISRELDQTDDAKFLTSKKGDYPVVKGDEIDHFEFRNNVKQYLNNEGVDRFKRRISNPRKKLAVRSISGTNDPRRLVCGILPAGCLTVNSIRVSACEFEEAELYFHQALLNSRIAEFVFRTISKNNNVNKFAVAMLPLPKFDWRNAKMVVISEMSKKLSNNLNSSLYEKLDDSIMSLFDLKSSQKEYLKEQIRAVGEGSAKKKRPAIAS